MAQRPTPAPQSAPPPSTGGAGQQDPPALGARPGGGRGDGRGPGPAALWFGTVGGAAAWTVHLSVTYPLVDFLCARNHAYILFIISGVAIVWDVAAGLVAWTGYKRLPAAERAGFTGEGSRRAFMLLLGVLGSGLFLLGIILATMPFFVFGPCDR